MPFYSNLKIFQMSVINCIRYKTKVLAVIIPLILSIGLATAVSLVKDGFQKDAELSARMLPDLTVQSLKAGRVERIQTSLAVQLKAIPHVRQIVPRIWGYIPLKANGRDVAYTIMGLELSRFHQSKDLGLSMESGAFPSRTGANEVVIGQALAHSFQLKPGDTFTLEDGFGRQTRFRVTGIFRSAVAIFAADLILMPLEDARNFFYYSENEASDLCLYLDNPLYADIAAATIGKQIPNLRLLTKDALGDITKQSYGGRAGVFGLLWLVILVAVLLTSWAQGAAVRFEAAREIGILKALGWSIADIIKLKLFESTIVAVLGTLLGMLLGFGYVFIGAPGIKGYFLGWSKVFPDFTIPVHLNPATLITIFIIGVVPLLFAAIIPAWWAGITEPDRTMRA